MKIVFVIEKIYFAVGEIPALPQNMFFKPRIQNQGFGCESRDGFHTD